MFNLQNRLHGVQLFLARQSLQTRFILIFALPSLLFALAAWTTFNGVAERMVERIGARFAEQQALYDKARTLQPLIREVALARQMAANTIIRQWAANEHDPQLYRQAMAELEKYRQRFQDGNYFLALTQSEHCYFNDARVQDSHPSTKDKQLRYTLNPMKPADAWFYSAIKNSDSYNLNAETNPNLGITRLWINVPLLHNGKVLGVLGTGLNMDSFTSYTAGTHQTGITSMLIDRNTAIQIYRDTGSIDFSGMTLLSSSKPSFTRLLDKPEDRAWIQQTITQLDAVNPTATAKSVYINGQRYSGNSIVATRFLHIKGKRYLASMVSLPETGWYNLTLLDMSVILPTHDYLGVMLAIGGVSLGLMIILLFALRRLVLKPVAVLTAASERIRRGDYAGTPAEKSGGEIGQLTAQFQAMRHAVHKTHHWMEEEIEKRTRELSEAKQMLEVSLQQEKNSRENQVNLLSLMAHEIRSPIAVIGNTAQMLNALARSQQPDWQPRIEKIMGAVLQLALLMNKFLDQDRLNMESTELDMQTGDLNIFCEGLADTLASNHCRRICFTPCDGDTMLLADWHLVGIAVNNLIDNAVKYSPPDSGIDICITRDQTNILCVEVTDHGPGIAPELQQRIFNEKFIRGEHGSNIRGTGLGLYLINWIATSHGGYAEVFSTPGSGSTFRFCLPVSHTRLAGNKRLARE
ncbi:MAG: ATP-binding protein [Gallionella sp.]|nr:ATP-binding protein [Gallionella sp.]